MIPLLLMATAQGADCTVVEGANVHLPDGPTVTDLRLADGRIAAIGDLEPGDCRAVEGAGMELTAGFVGTMTHLGLVEVSLEGATRDMDAGGADPVRAALRVADAYNPRSTVVPITRYEGITSAVIVPSGGQIAGQAAWVRLAGATQAEALVDPSVAMLAGLRAGGSRAEGLSRLAEIFDDARLFRDARPQWERNQLRALSASHLDLQALLPVLDGTTPLVIGANRAADIEALLRLRAELGLRLVISGGAEAWLHAEALAAADVPIILDPLVYGPGGFDQVHGRADNAALLTEAGVDVVIAVWDTHNLRALRQSAGNAVRGGMAHSDALRAVTSTPARIFGQDDRGEIRVGQAADLVAWTADPFEHASWAAHVWIDGRAVVLETRQTRLLDRYRELPGTPLAPLPLPE